MKRFNFLFIALALFAFISLSACKSSTEPAAEEATVEEAVVEETPVEEETVVVDTAAVADTTAAMEEEAAE